MRDFPRLLGMTADDKARRLQRLSKEESLEETAHDHRVQELEDKYRVQREEIENKKRDLNSSVQRDAEPDDVVAQRKKLNDTLDESAKNQRDEQGDLDTQHADRKARLKAEKAKIDQ
jgi:hypothetical protein